MADKSLSEQWREKNAKAIKGAESKYKQLKEQRKKGGLTWDDVNETSLHAAVASVVGDGAAILLARTSDGGALVIRVIEDGGGEPFYPSSALEAEETLKEIADTANKA